MTPAQMTSLFNQLIAIIIFIGIIGAIGFLLWFSLRSDKGFKDEKIKLKEEFKKKTLLFLESVHTTSNPDMSSEQDDAQTDAEQIPLKQQLNRFYTELQRKKALFSGTEYRQLTTYLKLVNALAKAHANADNAQIANLHIKLNAEIAKLKKSQ